MPTRQSGDEPAQSKHSSPPDTVRPILKPHKHVFEWYENRAQEGFATLYRVDVAQRQRIVEMIRELEDAAMFWSLLSKWEDATEEALKAKDDSAENEALMSLLARVYIAGTLRGCQAVDL